MSDVLFLFSVTATYLLLGAWVISRTGGSRVGVPVKVRPMVRRDQDRNR